MMGTATFILYEVHPLWSVGAYSMNDGDCDDITLRSFVPLVVGAYSMNDGDCDRRLPLHLPCLHCRSVFHE